jgi:hypothetical protein
LIVSNDDLASVLRSGNASIQDREQRAKLIAAVKQLADAPAPLDPAALGQLFALEEALYPVVQADKRWFFDHLGRVEAIQFSRDLHVLHSFAAKTLKQLIDRRGEWSSARHGEIDPLLHRAIAFAIFHLGASVKWCFYRHEPVKPTIWPDLHEMFRFAEHAGVAGLPIRLIENEAEQSTSVLALYLRTLLLEVLNTGSLGMPQIEIADGWLAEWTPDYSLDETYAPRAHALLVDLDAMAGLQLVTGVTPKPGFRYLRLEGLKAQIDAVRNQLRSGQPYHGRGTARHFGVDQHVALLSAVERLQTTILQASASRIEERLPVSGKGVDVVAGFARARMAIDQLGGVEVRRWRLHDLSSKGMGLSVDRVTGEQTLVGEMLAVKLEGSAHFAMGVVVRKVTQRASGETLLGVELLSYRPLPVVLQRFNHARDAEPDANVPPIEAAYLPGREAEGKTDVLALPGGDFGLKNVFKVTASGTHYRVRINRVLRKGRDWIGLRFEVIGKK